MATLPRARARHLRAAIARPEFHGTALTALLGIALLAAAPASAQSTQAEAEVQVVQDLGEYQFAESLNFVLDARADQAIERVVLRYALEDDGPRNRRLPEFEAGETIRAIHEEDLVRGQIPPAEEIRWWWSLTLADGSQTDTPVQSMTYLDQRLGWQSMEEAALRVWWYGDAEAEAAEVLAESQLALARIGDLVGSEPDRNVEIVTYQNQEDLRRAMADRGGTYETRLATLGARVADDILILDIGSRGEDVDEVLAHELSHIVLNLHLEEDYVNAPLWLDEGLAMLVEGELEREEQAVLDGAIEGDRLLSLRSLTSFPGDASLVPLAYAQSKDMVSFLLDRFGEEAFRDALDRIGSGEQTVDEALIDAFGMDQDGLYQAYRATSGLAPASEPAMSRNAPREPVAERSQRSPAGPGLPCAGAWILLPAVGLALSRSHRRRTRHRGYE